VGLSEKLLLFAKRDEWVLSLFSKSVKLIFRSHLNNLIMKQISLIFTLFFLLNSSCADSSSNTSGLSKEELVTIRDGFDKRVSDAFESQRGKVLVKAKIRPPLHSDRPEYSRGYSWSIVAYATRCFWLNEQIKLANDALVENAEYYLANPKRIYDRDNFHWHSEALLALIELFGEDGTKQKGLLEKETENKILEAAWLYCKRKEKGASSAGLHTKNLCRVENLNWTWVLNRIKNGEVLLKMHHHQ
jgi:hypothetical protein